LPAFFVGLHWTHFQKEVLDKLPRLANFGAIVVLTGLLYWFNYENLEKTDEEYNYTRYGLVEPFYATLPVIFLVQELVFFGYLKNTLPFYIFAALAAPIFAGTQNEESTASIGLYMGFVVEGVARLGMMIWEPRDTLELWWEQYEGHHEEHDDEIHEEHHEEHMDDHEDATDDEEEQWGEDF